MDDFLSSFTCEEFYSDYEEYEKELDDEEENEEDL